MKFSLSNGRERFPAFFLEKQLLQLCRKQRQKTHTNTEWKSNRDSTNETKKKKRHSDADTSKNINIHTHTKYSIRRYTICVFLSLGMIHVLAWFLFVFETGSELSCSRRCNVVYLFIFHSFIWTYQFVFAVYFVCHGLGWPPCCFFLFISLHAIFMHLPSACVCMD